MWGEEQKKRREITHRKEEIGSILLLRDENTPPSLSSMRLVETDQGQTNTRAGYALVLGEVELLLQNSGDDKLRLDALKRKRDDERVREAFKREKKKKNPRWKAKENPVEIP